MNKQTIALVAFNVLCWSVAFALSKATTEPIKAHLNLLEFHQEETKANILIGLRAGYEAGKTGVPYDELVSKIEAEWQKIEQKPVSGLKGPYVKP